MTKYILLLCSISVAGIGDPGALTLDRALELARKNSPELRAAQIHAQATKSAMAASGRWENPKLEFEAEGLGGDMDPYQDAEYMLGIMQKFPIGGKLEKEREAARHAAGASGHEAAERELEVLEKVRKAFVELLAQQETDKVRAEQEELGRALVKVAQRRLETGAGSELEVVQAELVLEETILSQTCCFGDLEAARVRLASLMGVPVKELALLTGSFYEPVLPEDLAVDDACPQLQRLEAKASQLRSEALRARAGDVSDLSLGAGYKHDAREDISTFVFSASVPLPFSRRGRAEHAAGILRSEALMEEREYRRMELMRELATGVALFTGAMAEVDLMKNKLMPKAEEAYELSRSGYEAGRFSWLELIAAQQSLAEIRIRYIDSLRDAHLALARISKFRKEGV
ncbi:MAG: TolC family protein [Verrucomicrobiota bacterium]